MVDFVARTHLRSPPATTFAVQIRRFNKVSRGTSNLLQHLETYIRNTSFNRRDRDKLSLTSFEGLAGKGRGDTMIIKYSPVSFERIRGRSFYFV